MGLPKKTRSLAGRVCRNAVIISVLPARWDDEARSSPARCQRELSIALKPSKLRSRLPGQDAPCGRPHRCRGHGQNSLTPAGLRPAPKLASGTPGSGARRLHQIGRQGDRL